MSQELIKTMLSMPVGILGIVCAFYGMHILVMGKLCLAKGIELYESDIRQQRQAYVIIAVAVACLIAVIAVTVQNIIEIRSGIAVVVLEFTAAGFGSFIAKRSVDENWERILKEQQENEGVKKQ